MALPSGEKECRHAVDVLEQLLELSDVKSAAEGALHTRQHSTVTLLTPVEETIVSNSRLVREQAAVLLGKLRAALSASGAADGSSSASPEFAASQLFIRKSRLLHERVGRVTVAFSSLKHAALLGENSTGRRVITDRASVSITELLDILMAAVSTLEESTLPSETEQKNTPSLPSSSRYVVLGAHSPIGVLDTKFTDSAHAPQKTTSCLDAKQRGAVLKHEREVMGEGVTTKDSDLTGDEEKKKTETTAWNKKNDEKGEAFTRSEKSKNVLPREEKESTHVFAPRKSSPSSTISSFSNTTASCGPMNKSTHSSSVLLHRNIDNNKKNSRHGTLSTSHSSSDTTGENVGSLETIATAHCVPIEKSSSVDDELLEPKHSPLPANTTVRTPVHKGDTATPSQVSTYRSTHKRLFRGKLWRELLHKDGDDTATSRWKEVFIQEVAVLFGIPTAWVSNVELVNDTPTHARVLHGGDQEVMFKVRLPLSLAKDEVNMRIQRHEFLNMLLLYEELQKEKEEMEEAKEREKKDKHEESDADTSNVSSFSKDDDGSTSPPEFENTEVLFDDAEACDVDLKNNSTGNLFGNNKDWSSEFLSLIHTETQSRDSLTIQEKYGRQLVLKASAKNWKKLGGAEVHGEEKQDKRSSYRQLHAAEQQEQQQEPEQGIEREVSGEMEVNKPSRATLPPLPPRSFTLPQQMSLSSSVSSLDKEETPSPAPVPTPLNTAMETRDDVDHKDSNILQNEESLKINRVPKPFQEKNIVSSQKLWEPTVQLISTCHEKIIKGDKWDIVLEKEKDELHRTFVVEVSNLFELPTEHVKELQFALGSLHASFTLMHDRYLQETEINALLAIFDFPQIRSLYERCLEGTRGSEPADLKGDISKKNIINNNGHGSLKGSNDQRLLSSSSSASSSVVPANDERGMKTSNDNSNNSPKAHGEASVPRLATKVLIHSTRMPTCRPRSSVDVLRKSTATPDNEPITLTHLSLLHDVTIDELLKANPSLAIFHPNEPIPSYTEIVIPRATMDSDHDDDECGIRESTDELNLSNIAMPIRISLTSSSHSIQTDDADGDVLKSLMNVKNIATNFGVGVQAFREQNTHLHSYGDLDPIPKNSPINIPAQMLPSSDSRGDNLSYFTTSQRRAMSRPSVLDDSLTQDAEENKNVDLSLKSNPLTHETDNVGEQEESLRKSETKLISQESSKTGEPPNQVNTRRFPTGPHNNSILTGTHSHPHPTHSSSTVMNPPISCENAVLVVRRSIEYFCLLRFFVKWQQIIQLKRRGQKLRSVHEISLGGANPRRGAYMDPVLSNSRYQITRRGVGQLNPRQLSSPRRETGPEHRVNLISRAIQAIAHVQHRGVSPRNVNSMISTLWGRLPSQTSQQIIQGRSSGNRTVSARSRVNRREGDRRGQSPVKSSRGVNQTNPFMSSSYRGAPHPIFSIASSNRFYSHAQNPERRSSKTHSSRALSDWLPLDIRVSSSLIILEAYGEAEAAGIQRGDQLREVEGVSVQSLKELGKVLESSNGTHIRVKILKKKSENITTIRLRRCTREALDITTSRSTSLSPTEPRITPMLSASKSSAFPSTRNHGHNPILLDRQQHLNNNAPNRPRRGY